MACAFIFSLSLLLGFDSCYSGSHLLAVILCQDVYCFDKQVGILIFKVLSMGAAQPPLPKLGMSRIFGS